LKISLFSHLQITNFFEFWGSFCMQFCRVASEWFAPAFQNKTDKTQTHREAKALLIGIAHKQKQNNLVSSSLHDCPWFSENKTCLWSPLWHRYARNLPGVLQPQFCLWIEESHAVHFIAIWVVQVCGHLSFKALIGCFRECVEVGYKTNLWWNVFFAAVLVTCIPRSYEQCKHQKEFISFISPNCVLHTQRNSTGESIPWELSILRSGNPIDCDLLLSYPPYPSLRLDAPKKEPLKLSLIEKLVGGDF
jgi:hypothetical protein